MGENLLATLLTEDEYLEYTKNSNFTANNRITQLINGQIDFTDTSQKKQYSGQQIDQKMFNIMSNQGTILRFHLTSVRRAVIRNANNNNVGEEVQKKPFDPVGGTVISMTL